MSTAMPSDDPVADFLDRRPSAEAGSELRQRVLSRTARVLRRRRWARRLRGAAALAVCILAGIAFGWWLRPATVIEQSPPGPLVPQARGPEALPAPKPKPSEPPAESALAQEWRAFDAVAERGRLYREAADRYLRENQDLAAALRCYTQALDAGGDDELVVGPEDSWLFIALKDARRKEKLHATVGN